MIVLALMLSTAANAAVLPEGAGSAAVPPEGAAGNAAGVPEGAEAAAPVPRPIEPRQVEPEPDDKTPTLPPADERKAKKHGVDEDRPMTGVELAVAVAEFGVGAGALVAAPFVADAATHDIGSAVVLPLSTVPAVFGMATGVAVTLFGVALLDGAEEARRYNDPCGCGCGPACGDVLEGIGQVLVITGVVVTVVSPLAFFATTTADKAFTGHEPNALPAIAGATAGAAVGVGGMVGLALLHDTAVDEDPPSGVTSVSLVAAGLGVAVLGATAGYVLFR